MQELDLIKFYFHGELESIELVEAKKKITEKGGIVREEFAKDVWYFVTNSPNENSDIVKKAKELGVTFIDENEFLKMIE